MLDHTGPQPIARLVIVMAYYYALPVLLYTVMPIGSSPKHPP